MAELVTTGSGEAERTADEATVQLRYVAKGKDRTAAVNALTRQITTVEPLLERAGVDVRTRRFGVHDTWEGRRRNGAMATQYYQVTITDVTAVNDLLGDLVTTEPHDLAGPLWGLADPTEAQRAAQRDAVADARAKAQGYAEALGGRLGQLIQLSDGGGGRVGRPLAFAASARAERATPAITELSLEPEPVTVHAMCTVTWELLA